MAILDEMQAAKEAAAQSDERHATHVWRVSDNALPAVQAGLVAAGSFPLVKGALLLGIGWERATDFDGWELAVRR